MTAVDKPALGALRSEEQREHARQQNEEARRQRAEAAALHLVEEPVWAHDFDGDALGDDDHDRFGERIEAGDLTDDQPGHDAPNTTVDRLRGSLLDGDDIEHLPPPEPLVADLLDLDSLAVAFGRPGSGKTHVAIDVALHVATGSWWHGHEVHAGHVLYVVAEGARGVGQRQRAWKQLNHYTGSVAGQVTWLPVPVNLLGLDQAQALATIAAERQAVLVIIDTLGRSMAGGDENAYRDMSLVIDAAERIRRATGACVLLVHHSGKDQSAGSRGHSSLLGAVTTELEVLNAGDGIITLRTTKQKDHADTAQPHRFVLIPAADSVALAPYTGQLAPGEEINGKAVDTLNALAAIATPGGIPTSVWRDAAIETGVGRSQFYVHVRTLLTHNLVRNIGTDKQPRYMPSDQEQQP